ncbi:MAG: chromosomal replication initiator protein DnaA [Planctomycetota bacterium]|jgi:chromosomal replication initiator protein
MTTPDPTLWPEMLAHLRSNHSDICRQWFEDLAPRSLDGGLLEVAVDNVVQQNYLQLRCTEQFNEAAQDATGALVAVRFVTADEARAIEPEFDQPATDSTGAPAPPEAPAPHGPTLSHQPQRPSKPNALGDDQIVLSPDYSFDNFITGPGNQLSYAASTAVAELPGKAYNPLFIHGGVGLGKTHLLQAICQNILLKDPNTRICYLSCDTFINQFLESVQSGKMSEFRNRYRHVDILLIDDIHFLANRERTQEEFFHTFNTLYQSDKQIVLSSDAHPNEIPQLEERLVSRFNWGLVATIEKPCYETRVAIVRTKSKIREIDMPDDVVCYIATKIDSNTRELEGAITRIQSFSELRNIPIDMPLAQQALGDEAVAATAPQLSIQNIIDAVTNYYGVKLADLQSKRRHRSITIPRQVCMYLTSAAETTPPSCTRSRPLRIASALSRISPARSTRSITR